MLDHTGQRSVLGAVVDHDDLEVRIMERQQRIDAFDDGHFFVEGGRENGDAGCLFGIARQSRAWRATGGRLASEARQSRAG
jgi:hypothetical protein